MRLSSLFLVFVKFWLQPAPAILEAHAAGKVTLLFAARDVVHNSAAVLKSYLEKHLASGKGHS